MIGFLKKYLIRIFFKAYYNDNLKNNRKKIAGELTMTNEENKTKKEMRNLSLATASREYYQRMKLLGYKKYGVLIKEVQMARLGQVASNLNITKFELLEVIIGEYLKALDKKTDAPNAK